ncbi:MAG: (Fe-S)-binding protein [Deltaproteobacteria bacterium]|nr:MAG: (Fe-S)-binding protein [Deltaproteobacteria bacterium]
MATSKNVLLIFHQEVMYKPIIHNLVRNFDLIFNILEAKILPRREGRLILELSGDEEAVRKGIEFLEAEGVTVKTIADQSRRDDELCVHCGACTAVCRPDALSVNPETLEVEFFPDRCVACGLCETACPMKALKGVNIERLGDAV